MTIKSHYRMIVSNIKRILYYLPLIWGIREWDHTYTMKVYVHQLKYQSKYLRENDLSVCTEYYNRRMNRTIRLLEIGYELDYEHYEKFTSTASRKEYELYQKKARKLAHKYILEEGGHWWD